MTQNPGNVGVLIAATIATGLMAGLFAAFAYAVMPALGRSGDRAFVEVAQNINKAILNGLFMLLFIGALILAIVAVIQSSLTSGHPALGWIIAALVLYVSMLLITGAVNIPLNDQIDRAGDPAHIADLAAVRANFEAKWVTWNIVRALTSTAAFGCLVAALAVAA